MANGTLVRHYDFPELSNVRLTTAYRNALTKSGWVSVQAVLQPVANLMAADKTLKLEVQGHTDNVGNDAHNQTLSEARAKAVVTWLTQHGVAADRLSAKGYGKTKPVADNGSDEGRAKNRRVEIFNPACSPKGN